MASSTVGKSLPRLDAVEKVRGGRGFPSELRLPGMLYGKIKRSPYPHARIKKIDTTKLKERVGVVVVTPQDFPRVPYHPKIGVDPDSSSMIKDCLVLEEVVRYVGDEVAAVAAPSEEEAEEALELLEVEYEELPYVLDPHQALREGAPKVHPSGNLAMSISRGWGDVERGLREADLVVEGSYSTQRVSQFPLETHACICDVDHEGNLTIYSSTQMIHGLRERISLVLQYPLSKIRVVKPPYIGGAFGAKLDMNPMEPLCAMLALKARRPVSIRLSREEEIISTAFEPTTQELKTGVKKDGTLVARYCRMVIDAGAHSNHAPSVCQVAASSFLSAYRSEHALFEGSIVYTNNPPAGAYRGYGGPQGLFGLEQQMDEIAEELGMDPLELRLKNAWRVGEPNPRVGGALPITSYAFDRCLSLGAEAFGWRELRRARKEAKGVDDRWVRGVGMACIPLGGSGITGKKGGSIEASGAIVRLNVDGSIDLVVATIDQGGGQSTILAQIVAEELGARVSDIRLAKVDTDTSPFDAPTHATRVTFVVGSVVRRAARELKEKVLKVAGEALNARTEALSIRDGTVYVKGDEGRGLSLADVAKRSIYSAPGEQLVGSCYEAPQHNPTPSGAHFVEVEVDRETGRVKVLRVVAAHDVGKAINPAGVEGQIEGAVAQGLGYALSEGLQTDDRGHMHGLDLADYKMMGSLDAPPVHCVLIEEPDPFGPFGAKGVSEPAIIPVAPAIANALYDALGIRFRSLPITPEAVLKAINKGARV